MCGVLENCVEFLKTVCGSRGAAAGNSPGRKPGKPRRMVRQSPGGATQLNALSPVSPLWGSSRPIVSVPRAYAPGLLPAVPPGLIGATLKLTIWVCRQAISNMKSNYNKLRCDFTGIDSPVSSSDSPAAMSCSTMITLSPKSLSLSTRRPRLSNLASASAVLRWATLSNCS